MGVFYLLPSLYFLLSYQGNKYVFSSECPKCYFTAHFNTQNTPSYSLLFPMVLPSSAFSAAVGGLHFVKDMDISYVFSTCELTQIKQQTALEFLKTKLMVLFGHILGRGKLGCWNLEDGGNKRKRLGITALERSVPSCMSCLLCQRRSMMVIFLSHGNNTMASFITLHNGVQTILFFFPLNFSVMWL